VTGRRALPLRVLLKEEDELSIHLPPGLLLVFILRCWIVFLLNMLHKLLHSSVLNCFDLAECLVVCHSHTLHE
jgi:hypothetical protein